MSQTSKFRVKAFILSLRLSSAKTDISIVLNSETLSTIATLSLVGICDGFDFRCESAMKLLVGFVYAVDSFEFPLFYFCNLNWFKVSELICYFINPLSYSDVLDFLSFSAFVAV